MPQNPYIPSQDAAFDTWLNNFQTLIAANPTDYGLVTGDATAITAAYTPWHAAYVLATTPATRTSPAIAEKDAQRILAEGVVRPYATTISRNPAVSNDLKTGVGVNLPNTARTPIPPPTTQPALSLVAVVHGQITLAYRDTSTPTSKAKPFGAIGVDLRATVGTAPGTDPDAATPLTVATKSPIVLSTAPADVTKYITYWGRWVTRSGPGGQSQYGTWGAPLTVVAM